MPQIETICSTYFRDLVAWRPYSLEGRVLTTPQVNGQAGGFMHRFFIPAAKPGEYHLLDVGQMYELQRDGSRNAYATAVYPDGPGGLAEDLVREWRDHKPYADFGKPGIFVCAHGRLPHADELQNANLTQTALCEVLCAEAEDHAINGKQNLIHDWHRDAAKWLGRLQYKWLHSLGQIVYMECPMCATRVDNRAARCPECGAIFDFARVEKYELEKTAFDARMAEARKIKPVAAALK